MKWQESCKIDERYANEEILITYNLTKSFTYIISFSIGKFDYETLYEKFRLRRQAEINQARVDIGYIIDYELRSKVSSIDQETLKHVQISLLSPDPPC
jgi:hypothetical protein